MRKLAALLVVTMATLNISTAALGAEVEEATEGIETPVETASNEEIEAGRPEESLNLQSSSGKCGTWLDYTIDDDNKLVITGKLEMTSAPWTWKSHYYENGSSSGWYSGWLWRENSYYHDVYTGTAISSVIFPDELTTICDYAFTRDTEEDRNNGAAISLVTPILNQNLTLPARLLSIGTEAFYESEIKNITFNDQLKTIGDGAFEYCSNLKGDIKIPKSVESIGTYAFAFLKNNEGQLSFENGGNLKEIKTGTFRECAFTGRVEFPEGLETIGSNAFTEDAFITELYIPATVTSIAADAFDKTDIKKIDYEGSEAAWKKLGFDKVNGFDGVGVDFGNSNMTCTVSFNTGFDDITVPSQTVDFDKYITKPEVKKIGYRLDGWYKDKEFNQIFDFANETLIKNTTLYAKWTQMSDVVVTFRWCDGTEDTEETVSTNSVTYGTKVAKPADPVRTGYNFKGWYADDEYKEEFDFDQELTSDVDVYAKWEMNSTPTPTPTPTPDTPGSDDVKPTPTPDTPNSDDVKPTPTPDTPSTDDQNKNDSSNNSTVVRVKPANTYVAGEKINIHELYFPYLSSVDKYRVSDKKTASIGKRGVLKGRRAGTVKVEAIRGKGKKAMVVATCEVTILSKPKLKFKEYTTLGEIDNAYNYFNTADIGTAVDKWQSTKPGVATIDAKTGEIHIVGKGTTKIYAYFGNCKVKAKLKVKPS